MILELFETTLFLFIGVWFLVFSYYLQNGKLKIMNSLYYISMVVLLIILLALQSIETFLGSPFDFASWKLWIGLISLGVYCIIIPIFSKEFFIVQISEEDFYSVLCNYLQNNGIDYKVKDTNGIPISEGDLSISWYYIYPSKTGYIKSKNIDHYKKAKIYFSGRINKCETQFSFQRFLFLILGVFASIIGFVKIFQILI